MVNHFRNLGGIIVSSFVLVVILYFSYQAKIHLQSTTNVGSEAYNITEKSFSYLSIFTELSTLEIIEIIFILIAIIIGVVVYIYKKSGGSYKS